MEMLGAIPRSDLRGWIDAVGTSTCPFELENGKAQAQLTCRTQRLLDWSMCMAPTSKDRKRHAINAPISILPFHAASLSLQSLPTLPHPRHLALHDPRPRHQPQHQPQLQYPLLSRKAERNHHDHAYPIASDKYATTASAPNASVADKKRGRISDALLRI
ncbi:hypothetical protein J1614_010837 [Plenodomus biglobosus]|nr:hypothetical protein J1614_010837 [Plenodomus biglobosus]